MTLQSCLEDAVEQILDESVEDGAVISVNASNIVMVVLSTCAIK